MYTYDFNQGKVAFVGSAAPLVKEALTQIQQPSDPEDTGGRLSRRLEYRVNAAKVTPNDYEVLVKAHQEAEGNLTLIVERFEEANEHLEGLLLIAKGLGINVDQAPDELSYSQEGIVDFFKGLFSDSGPKRMVTSDEKATANEVFKKIKQYVEKYYLNDAWLAKQTFVDELKDFGFTSYLIVGRQGPDPAKSLQEAYRIRQGVLDPWIKILRPDAEKLHELHHDWSRRIYFQKEHKAVLEEIALFNAAYEFPVFKTNGKVVFGGGHTLTAVDGFPRWASPTKPLTAKVKPLDAQGIKLAARSILSVIDDYLNTPVELNLKYPVLVKNEFLEEILHRKGMLGRYARYMDYYGRLNAHVFPILDMVQPKRTVAALEHWIFHSIKR